LSGEIAARKLRGRMRRQKTVFSEYKFVSWCGVALGIVLFIVYGHEGFVLSAYLGLGIWAIAIPSLIFQLLGHKA